MLALDQGMGVWGAQRYLLRLQPLLARLSIDITLGCPAHLKLFDVWTGYGLPALDLALPTDRSIRVDGQVRPTVAARELSRSARVPSRIAHALRNGDFDAVWANSHWTHLDSAIAARMARRPAVLHLHEVTLPGLGSRLRDVAVALSTQSVAVSAAVAEAAGGVARKKVTVVPNGVDTDMFRPPLRDERSQLRADLGIRDDDVMVFAATRIDPSKRVEDLVALSRSLGVHERLVVAGTTSDHSAYERAVLEMAAHDAGAAITFLGERDDVPELMRAADLYVHTGLVEGMPLGIIEAQASGLPVVAYDAPGVREALDDGNTATVVAPTDIQALSGAVAHLVGDRASREAYGARARLRALDNHSLVVQARTNAHLLRTVTGRRS